MLNGLVNLLTEEVSWHQIMGSEPAAHAMILEISMKALSQQVIFSGIADKDAMILDRVHHQGVIVNEKKSAPGQQRTASRLEKSHVGRGGKRGSDHDANPVTPDSTKACSK